VLEARISCASYETELLFFRAWLLAGLFSGDLWPDIVSCDLIYLRKRYRFHLKLVQHAWLATSGSLLAVSEIILRKHIALPASKEEG
jgi:hypothetical protein